MIHHFKARLVRAFLCLPVLFLMACDGPTAVEPTAEYVGEWVYLSQHGKLGGSDYAQDKRYLRIDTDGSSVYTSCYRARSGNSTVRTSIDPVASRLTKLNDGGFTVRIAVPGFDVVGADLDFSLQRAPYQEGDRWKMAADDVIWLKRKANEPDPLEAWTCPEDV